MRIPETIAAVVVPQWLNRLACLRRLLIQGVVGVWGNTQLFLGVVEDVRSVEWRRDDIHNMQKKLNPSPPFGFRKGHDNCLALDMGEFPLSQAFGEGGENGNVC